MPPASPIEGVAASPNAYAPLESASEQALSPSGPNTRQKRLRWVAVFAAVCGLVCVAVGAVAVTIVKATDNGHKAIVTNLQLSPGLKFTLHFKRASLKVYGLDEATIFVAPRHQVQRGGAASSFQFDAIMTLQATPTQLDIYTLVDDKGYFSQSNNGTTSAMESSVIESRVIDGVEGHTEITDKCVGGTLLSLTFAGESFVFCNSAANELAFAVGQDMDISIEYLADPTQLDSIQVPSTANEVALDCPSISQSSHPATLWTAPPTTRSLARATMETLTSNHILSVKDKSACACKGAKKPCLFVHGTGEDAAGPPTSSFSSYWGDVSSPCCSSSTFVHWDTVSQGWDDAALQHEFCKAAADVATQSSSGAIGGLILVTHSMGNVIASGAIASNVCTFSKDVTWVSLASPQQGSQAVNLLQQKCRDGGWNDFLTVPLSWAGYCPPARAYLSLRHQSTVNRDKQAAFATAQWARQEHVSHAACGVSGFGLKSIYSEPLALVDKMASHASASDGLVDFNSCSVGLNTKDFGGTSSKHYVGPLNHADLTFRMGDGWWGDNRKPLKWFQCLL
ncbi:hypothetical protein DYB30_011311 [Aphanomyces astaci]|uniref:Uncharacterized protein n=1 Tax=Aphanomyces astaci TaxID=112090 RepID=A0A397EJJ2_APHAT|nr:hypothetical protein DYB30_011311 [Aphanomyces astaci]